MQIRRIIGGTLKVLEVLRQFGHHFRRQAFFFGQGACGIRRRIVAVEDLKCDFVLVMGGFSLKRPFFLAVGGAG